MARSGHVIEDGVRRWNRPRTEFDTVARALRVNSPKDLPEPLFPQGAGGRGEGVHLDLRPINNLFLGVAVADPRGSAAEIVLAYRQCLLHQPLAVVLGERDPIVPILPGSTLGEALDGLVDVLARGGDRAKAARKKYAELRIILPIGRAGVARVELGAPPEVQADLYDARQYESEADVEEAANGFDRFAALKLKDLSMMAEFWADTLAHRARQSTSSDGGGQTPKTESAASRPGEAAPVGSRNRRPRTPSTRETARAGSRDQASSAFGFGCLPSSITGSQPQCPIAFP